MCVDIKLASIYAYKVMRNTHENINDKLKILHTSMQIRVKNNKIRVDYFS